MKPYDELSRLGRIRRLRGIAVKALEDYDIKVTNVRFLTIETNTMFQVQDQARRRYVLRIYSDEETTLKENLAEMFWLDALRRDTDLRVTEPIPRRDGEYITFSSLPGVPPKRRCVLFKWIPGRTLDNFLSFENYFKLGQSLAKLHNHAESLKPIPSNINPKKWDKVFYYPEEPIVYNKPEYGHLFPPELVRLLDKVIKRSDDMFTNMFSDPKGLILIHGDLHYWNVHYYQGQLFLIDFEDINLGYPIQDIAVTLSYGRHLDGYNKWKTGFMEGYQSVRKWPREGERTIKTLMAARTVMFINYVARIDPAPEQYIKDRCEELKRYLKDYGYS